MTRTLLFLLEATSVTLGAGRRAQDSKVLPRSLFCAKLCGHSAFLPQTRQRGQVPPRYEFRLYLKEVETSFNRLGHPWNMPKSPWQLTNALSSFVQGNSRKSTVGAIPVVSVQLLS